MKVIVAVDQTEFAEQIVKEVASSDWPLDTQIKILTVVQPKKTESGESSESAKEFERREKTANEQVMNAREVIGKSCPQCMVHAEVRCGEPHLEIIYSAAEWMPDRIVIGAHGSSPNRFFGSVAQSISKNCACSVQIVRLKKLKSDKSKTDAQPANVSR